MTQPIINSNYGVFTGTTTNDIAVPVFSDRNPTIYDSKYLQGKRWINEIANSTFELTSFYTQNGLLFANWTSTSGGGGTVTGVVIQYVFSQTNSVVNGPTEFPDVLSGIPQITDGDQYFSLTITPENASNLLVIKASINGSAGGSSTGGFNFYGVALFLNSDTNAIYANMTQNSSNTSPPPFAGPPLNIVYIMTAGSTSALTISLRAGGIGISPGSVFSLNGIDQGSMAPDIVPMYGGAVYSNLEIYEITA